MSLHLRLLGFDVEVQAGFWIMVFLSASRGLSGGITWEVLLWVAVVFISILIHELGHALAFRRFGVPARIVLWSLGGLTFGDRLLPLSRKQDIIVSVAGPFAGFVVAVPIYLVGTFAPQLLVGLPPPARLALHYAEFVGLWWGLFNLLPVIPLDGGHVMENLLGPRHARVAAGISLVFAIVIGGGTIYFGEYWVAFLMARSLFESWKKVSTAARVERAARAGSPIGDAELPPEATALLTSARHALAEEQAGRARDLARRVLGGDDGTFAPTRRALREAHEIVAWAALLDDDAKAATDALAEAARHGEPEAAVAGAVHLARGDAAAARRVLDAARRKGDDRKQVLGPLIQILIQQGEIREAASIGLGMVEQLNDDDARQMARIAFDAREYATAAKLDEAVFSRTNAAGDAVQAARALTLAGQQDKALAMLKRAVDAGLSDHGGVWSDAALSTLSGLAGVVPRP